VYGKKQVLQIVRLNVNSAVLEEFFSGGDAKGFSEGKALHNILQESLIFCRFMNHPSKPASKQATMD